MITITELLNGVFFSGSGTSSDVPGKFDCALDGFPFMLDDKHETFRGGISTIPLLRSQADASDEPGESSTNPEDLWPRSQHSFHKGAGQQWLDLDDGDRFRFWNSRGVDVWTRGQAKTLNSTSLYAASSNANLKAITVGDFVYVQDGNTLKHIADVSIGNTATFVNANMPVSPILDICTDGFNVYASNATALHRTTKGATTSSSYNVTVAGAQVIGFHKGRLMAAKDNVVHNVTGSGAPTWTFTHPNTDFKWTAFGAGTGAIYMAGYSGDKSVIYYVTVKEDGTGLDVPQVAGELPDGEIARSLCGYLGYLNIGTDNGRRLATMESNNFLSIGALNPSNSPVLAFEPQDRFVWYSWTNFDTSFTGLGRMDLSTFTEQNVPAYASDLMYGSTTTGFEQQGSVSSIVTSRDRRLFTVQGKGLVRENLGGGIIGAYIETSEITYGIPDEKVALKLAIEHEPFGSAGIIFAYVSADSGEYQYIDKTIGPGRHPAQPFSLNEVTASTYRLKFVLSSETSTPTSLNRYTLRSYPVPQRGRTIVIPLLLRDSFFDTNGGTEYMNVEEAFDHVQNLASSGRLIRYQELGTSYSVFIDQIQFERWKRSKNNKAWQGTLACKLKVLGE